MNETCRSVAPVLPVDVAEKVLMLLDQKQRVQSCALLGHNWNTAAKLTISEITCRLGAAEQYQALSSWLRSNSSQISSIEVCSKLDLSSADINKLPTLQLPVSELQELQILGLQYCHLQPITTAIASSNTAAAVATPASLAALTALRTLKLQYCVIDPFDLGTCTNLQHLHLSPALPTSISTCSIKAKDEGAAITLEGLFAVALEKLQQLTFLSLDQFRHEATDAMRFELTFIALSSLPQLQVLEVGSRVDMPAYCFARLPMSLRKLKISSCRLSSRSPLPLEAALHLQRLSNLQHLHLHDARLKDPDILLSCIQLTGLDLTGVTVDSGDPDETEEEALINLLAVLQNLQQLRHLGLSETLEFMLFDHQPYAAITASSHLTSLDLNYCYMESAAVNNIFRAAQPCRGLITATLTSHLLEFSGSYQLLVNCCPALQYLDIDFPWAMDDIGHTDVQGISALQALADLTSLWFGGLQLSDDALASIAQCQQLKDFGILASDVSVDGLQHLTRLTGLTRLSFRNMASDQPDDIYLLNQAAADSPPDVHQQLNSHLEQQQQKQQQAVPMTEHS